MLHENKHLEEGIKEILVALQDNRKRTHKESGISVPSLERLVTVSNIYDLIIQFYVVVFPKLTGKHG